MQRVCQARPSPGVGIHAGSRCNREEKALEMRVASSHDATLM